MNKDILEDAFNYLITAILKQYESKYPDRFFYIALPSDRRICTVVTPDNEKYELQITQMRVPYKINTFELARGKIDNLDDLIIENFKLHFSNMIEVELNKNNIVYAFYADNLAFDRIMYHMTYEETVYVSFNFLLHSI